GRSDAGAEYDRLVVQILAKTVEFTGLSGSPSTGLTDLSVSGCGLRRIEDVLDLTPIFEDNKDDLTRPFRLESLNLSYNFISDVSVLITEAIFPRDNLRFLDLRGNNICDVDNVRRELLAHFTHLTDSSLLLSSADQRCECDDPVSFSSHQVCREVDSGFWDVECWKGYYFDMPTGECKEALIDENKVKYTTCEGRQKISSDIEDSIFNSVVFDECNKGFIFDPYEKLCKKIPTTTIQNQIPQSNSHDNLFPIFTAILILCGIIYSIYRCFHGNILIFYFKMQQKLFLTTDAVIQTVEPVFVHEGEYDCSTIPGDSPNIKSVEFPTIKAIDGTKDEDGYPYDQSSNAQRMMKGEFHYGYFTHISIPFSSSSPMKGAYICLYDEFLLPSHLIFTLTSSKGDKTSKKYEFPEFEDYHWYFLPVDLPDVVLCEITGKARKKENFGIFSLVSISREETPEEIKSREAREKLWSETPVVKPEFVKKGYRDSIPIARDDPKLVDPSFSMVKCKNDVYSKQSEEYDKSSRAQKMLKGERGVCLSHLSIPFPSPSPMKGAYICVDKNYSSPSLLFTFTDCDGKKTYKKYEFTQPEHVFEWHFFSIDLDSVVLCEIEGKGTWKEKDNRHFNIHSLVFLRGDDIPTSPPLLTPVPVSSSSSKTATSTLSLSSKTVKERQEEEQEEIVIKGNDKDSTPKDTKQKKPKDGKPKDKPKHDSFTLTSADLITLQCKIGTGGFGEVLLVKVDGIDSPCVLKKMLKIADKRVVKDCRKEFKMQQKLFMNGKCFNRIPRPLYILDLLDADMKGEYGFIMEYCAGGSVKDFARSWCIQGDGEEGEEDEEECSSEEDSGYYKSFDPMALNPVKVCSLSKKSLVHRDIKPDNFLVRVDPDSKKCTVVLADLGLAQIQDSISSSMSSRSFVDFSSKSEDDTEAKHKLKRPFCGTLVYNSFEALKGDQSQESDAYSLGLTIFALFKCKDPFLHHPVLQCIDSPTEYAKELSNLISNGMGPKLCESRLFKTLNTIEGGKFKTVYSCLNEIFEGLTKVDIDERMSVHEACEKVQSIKDLLPKIGEGWEYPSIDKIVEKKEKMVPISKSMKDLFRNRTDRMYGQPNTLENSLIDAAVCIIGKNWPSSSESIELSSSSAPISASVSTHQSKLSLSSRHPPTPKLSLHVASNEHIFKEDASESFSSDDTESSEMKCRIAKLPDDEVE
ncbi:hypothetical protein ADUPG1_006703, partial [Aduncisulcus paluster]